MTTGTAITALSKCKAIVMFGYPTETSGMRAGTFYQVTLDPEMLSPGGDYIRLGHNEGDEIHGWQQISGLTVVEVLGVYNADGSYPTAAPGADEKQLRVRVIDELHTP